MENKSNWVSETIHIKNMVSHCCVRILQMEFLREGIMVHDIILGQAKISYDPNRHNLKKIAKLLEENGFGLIINHEEQIVEQIKVSIIELIHDLNNVNSIIRKSEYLVEKIGLSYSYLTKLFSKHEGISLEKFVILHKIERIKELINSEEFTLSEIAYMMDYSSVQYLSNQFKRTTGYTVSEYKKLDSPDMNSLESLY